MASRTPDVPLAASVSDWAKVNWSSKVPPARSSRPTSERAYATHSSIRITAGA